MTSYSDILLFTEVGLDDLPRVGGKNANLGELTQRLSSAGVRVPAGFATTAQLFRDYIEHNQLGPTIEEHMTRLQGGHQSLLDTGRAIRAGFLAGQQRYCYRQ